MKKTPTITRRKFNLTTDDAIDSYIASSKVPSELEASFKMSKTFNATDYVLQTISYWPDIGTTEYFQSRLKFQVFQIIWKSNLFDRNIEGVTFFS